MCKKSNKKWNKRIKREHHWSVGRLLQYFLIAIFAWLMVTNDFISGGHWFQSLAVSKMKQDFPAFEFASSFQSLIVELLTSLPLVCLFGSFGSNSKGYSSMFMIFQASNFFISADYRTLQ